MTLISTELDLLTKKTATNRLGIALLLKYFQYEGRFLTSKAEIPRDVVRYVAQLVKVSPDRFDSYDWQGRTIKAHRAIVRDFLGIFVERWASRKEAKIFNNLLRFFSPTY